MRVYSAEELAQLLLCTEQTVQEQAAAGELPGLKFGRGWVFPEGALEQRLTELALEQAAERRAPKKPRAVQVEALPAGARRHRAPPSLGVAWKA